MTIRYSTLYFLALIFVFYSCKNEANKTNDANEANEVVQPVTESSSGIKVVPAPKKVLNEEEKNQVTSILSRAMYTAEIKTFVSLLVTTELANMLMMEDGPFTILAPTNAGFEKINKARMDFLLNSENKEELVTLVKSHIIKGSLDSGTLVKNIKNANGAYKIITMSGATFTASRDSTSVVLTDVKGKKASIGKSDINGSNGVLHILDAVLSID